ncbi:MAG: hypothetical protein EOM73_15490 [Bacteroidia bacterium]|nr:hypothetical protein [Bacteroidia bacterium]
MKEDLKNEKQQEEIGGGITETGEASGTEIIQCFIQGCPSEYSGEQKAAWQLARLRKEAEKQGFLRNNFDELKQVAKAVISGTEAVVLFIDDEDDNPVLLKGIYPLRQLAPYETLDYFINRIELYNKYFPETRLEFRGVSDSGCGVVLLFSQPFINGLILTPEPPACFESFEQAKNRLKKENKLFKKKKDELKKRFQAIPVTGSRTKYTDNNVIMNDVHLGNVMNGTDGKLYFIDMNIEKINR